MSIERKGVMAEFADPFSGNIDRKMTNPELMQALRIDIAAELEAIYLYEAHYLATDDPAAKKVLADIRDEEKAHVGELITLMRYLDPTETDDFLSGEAEVNEMIGKLNIEPKPAHALGEQGLTVGDLTSKR
jgi:rubrerythrin